MRRPAILALLLSLLALSPLAAAQPAQPLKQRMTPAEFQAAGLDKLSADELSRLDAFLQGQVADAVEVAVENAVENVQEQRRGFRNPFASSEKDREPIVAHLQGEFTGWRGSTVFNLDNGQVWQQTDGGSLAARRKDSPKVTIRPGMLGVWWLTVEGYGTNAKVERIK